MNKKDGTGRRLIRLTADLCDPVLKICYPRMERHWMDRYKKRFPRHAGKILAFDLSLWFVMAALVVTAASLWIFTLTYRAPQTAAVQIIAPGSTTSGAETDVIVRYSNGGDAPLRCAIVLLETETQFLATKDGVGSEPPDAGCGAPDIEKYYRYGTAAVIGDIPAYFDGELKLRGIFSGAAGTAVQTAARLVYWEEGRIAPSEADSRLAVALSDGVLRLSLDAPSSVIRGAEAPVRITYENATDAPIARAVIRLDTPDDYAVSGSTPAMRRRGEWVLTDIAPGAKEGMIVHGLFGRQLASASVFTVAGYVVNGPELLVAESRVEADPAASGFALSQELRQPSGPRPLVPGETVTVAVRYENRGETILNDARITLLADPRLIAEASPADLSWDKRTMPELAEIIPGETGELTASFTVSENAVDALTLVSRARFTAQGGVVIDETTPIDLPITTLILLKAATLYFTRDGEQLGLGPVPPLIGETTKYRVVLSLENGASGARGAVIEGRLPESVEWTGRANVSAGEALDYFPSTRMFRWRVSGVAAYADDIGAAFEVAITPTEDLAGTIPLLVTDLSAEAVDSRTGWTIRAFADAVTSAIPYGRTDAEKSGVVR